MKQSILDSTPLVVSQESIAFQSRAFGQEIEQFFAELLAACKTTHDFNNFVKPKKLEDIIKKYTNMTVKVITAHYEEWLPAIRLPILGPNNILIKGFHQGWTPAIPLKELIHAVNIHKDHNGVDLNTGKVFGLFEDIESKLYLPPWFVTSGIFSAGECAATILHEIGHSVTFFEYVDRTVTTNQVLASLSYSLTTHKDPGVRVGLIKDVQKQLKLVLSNPDELATKKGDVIFADLVSASTKVKISGSNSSIYDETASEQLADQYVVRCGYGKDLATTMDKIYQYTNRDVRSLRIANYISVSTILVPAVVGVSIASPILLLIAGLGSALEIWGNRSDNQNLSYDSGKVRLQRIREDLINLSKNKNLPVEDIKDILFNIEKIDEVIKRTHDNDGLFRAIADFLFTDSKAVTSQQKLHRQLEELASNDLFLAAAKLKTL